MSNRIVPYDLSVEGDEADERYFVSLADASRQIQKTEISEELYEVLSQFNSGAETTRKKMQRHPEYEYIAEERMPMAKIPYAASAEDVAFANLALEELKGAFAKLPPQQAKRYLMKHVMGFSYAEIAEIEGCSYAAVNKSLVAAKKKLQEILRNGVMETPSKCPYK